MYQRVLLAYDSSREGRTALREGALLARRLRAKTFLLCVVKPDVAERLGDPCVNLAPIEEEAATALFEEAKIRIAELGLEAEARILRGDPIRLIAAQARRFSADLVVVGHRRKGFLERWWSDLTEASLADQLTCTVLVARREISDEEFRSLVAEG